MATAPRKNAVGKFLECGCLVNHRILEHSDRYELLCKPCGHHNIPKVGKPGANWTFNGDFTNPSFTPSMNETRTLTNDDDSKTVYRCHFVLTNGVMNYCSDCTHNLAGQSIPLEPFSEASVLSAQLSINQLVP